MTANGRWDLIRRLKVKYLNRERVHTQYIVKPVQRTARSSSWCKIKENLLPFLSRIWVRANVFVRFIYDTWTISNSSEGNLGTGRSRCLNKMCLLECGFRKLSLEKDLKVHGLFLVLSPIILHIVLLAWCLILAVLGTVSAVEKLSTFTTSAGVWASITTFSPQPVHPHTLPVMCSVRFLVCRQTVTNYCARLHIYPVPCCSNYGKNLLVGYHGNIEFLKRINTGWHKKNGNFWKIQQKFKKSKKEKKLLTEIEPLQLAF